MYKNIGRISLIPAYLTIDALVVAMGCFIPTASHLLSFPLYKLNPMLAILLAGMLMGTRMFEERNNLYNALLLAVLMPIVSCWLTGMPAVSKMACMLVELAIVVGLFAWLSHRWGVFPAILTAIFVGKVIYYVLKYVILDPVVLVETEWWLQLSMMIVWGGLFSLLYKKSNIR